MGKNSSTKWTMEDVKAKNFHISNGIGKKITAVKAVSKKDLKKVVKKKKPISTDFIKVEIKPLSVNAAWQGRRFKTEAYKKYEKEVLSALPELVLPEKPYSWRSFRSSRS